MVQPARRGANLGNAAGQVVIETGSAQAALRAVTAGLKSLDAQGAATARSVGAINQSLASAGTGIANFQRLAVGAIAAVGLERAATNVVQAAATLEQGVKNIQSIRPDVGFQRAFDQLNELSTRVPQSATALADGLYNIFSSINVSFDGGIELLEQFSRGATAAQTDAETFGTAIVGVMNAYNLSVADAARVQDIFFNTVNRGVVTGAELARNLGFVSGTARTAGLSVEELGAAIAGVTKQGGPAAQNINNLANLLAKIVTKDATEEMARLGVAVADSSGKIRPLFDVLGDLKVRLDLLTPAARAVALQQIFPDFQARQGAVVLMNQLEEVRGFLEENRTASGSASRAFTTMVSTLQNQAIILKNTFRALLNSVAGQALPGLVRATQALTGVVQASAAVLPDLGTAVAQAFARIASTGADVGRLEGVLNRLFGVGSPVVAGFLNFLGVLNAVRTTVVTNIGQLAAVFGTAALPISRFVEGLGALRDILGKQLFPDQLDEEIKTTARGMDGLRQAAEANREPLARFFAVLGGLLREITTSKEFGALAAAITAVGKAAASVLGSVTTLISALIRPFTGTTPLGENLGRLTNTLRGIATNQGGGALTVIEGIRRALDGIAGVVNAVATGLAAVARGIDTIAGHLDASGAIYDFRNALKEMGDALGPVVRGIAALVPGLKALTGGTGITNATQLRALAPTREALVDLRDQTDIAEVIGATMARIVSAIAAGISGIAAGINTITTFFQVLRQQMDLTGATQRTESNLNGLAQGLANLARAPFDGIAAGFAAIARSSEDADKGMAALAVRAEGIGTIFGFVGKLADLLAERIRLLGFAVVQYLGAFEALSRGDLAGALGRAASAIQAANDPRLITKPFSEAVDQVIADQKRMTDAIRTIQEAPRKALEAEAADLRARRASSVAVEVDLTKARRDLDRWREELASVPPTVSTAVNVDAATFNAAFDQITRSLNSLPTERGLTITAEGAQALREVGQLRSLIEATPRTFTVTAQANIDPALREFERLGRNIPRSPAEEGPLSTVPDWSYLTANLPDVLNQMIALVQRAGREIGGEKQIELFSSIAQALQAAAGAVQATVGALNDAAGFVRPSVQTLEDVALSLGDVLVLFQRLGGSISAQAAERVQQVAEAGSAAMNAIGAAAGALTQVRDASLPNFVKVEGLVSAMAAVLEQVAALGGRFSPAALASVETVGSAASAAMGGLAAAIEPLTRLRSFVGPSVAGVVDVIDHISGVMVRLSELGLAFSSRELERSRALGDAVGSAMAGLAQAVTALTQVRSFNGFNPSLIEGVFDLLSNVAVRFRDLSLAFQDSQAEDVQRVAGAIQSSFQALASALDVLPRLARTQVPNVDRALAGLVGALVSALRALGRVATELGQDAVEQAGAFSEQASKAVGLIGQGVDAFAKLAAFRSVSAGQINAFAQAVRVSLVAIGELARTVDRDLTAQAGEFSEATTKALGVLGAAASLQQLATFVAPSRGAIQRFFAVLRVAVDELIAESRRVAPEIARQMGDAGEEIGRAMGGLGAAIEAFVALSDFQPGKGFEQKVRGLLHFVRLTMEQLRALAASFGDTAAVVAFADALQRVAQALSAFIAAASGATDTAQLRTLVEVVRGITGAVGSIAVRTEHVIRFEGGFQITVSSPTADGQEVGAAVAGAVKDEIVVQTIRAVRQALQGAVA